MMTKGIRGAITVEENTEEAVKQATVELFEQLIKANNLKKHLVSHVIFTVTKDIDAAYPAKFVRSEFGWNYTAFMCEQEMFVKESLPMCIRVLVVYNCEDYFKPAYVYLKGAENLRK